MEMTGEIFSGNVDIFPDFVLELAHEGVSYHSLFVLREWEEWDDCGDPSGNWGSEFIDERLFQLGL